MAGSVTASSIAANILSWIDHAGAEPEGGAELVAVPEGEGIPGDQRHRSSWRRRGGPAGDEGILVGVAAGDLPRASHVPGNPQLESVGALAPRLHRFRRIESVRCGRVGPVETIGRRRERQSVEHVPLGAHFVVRELLGARVPSW